MKGLHPSATPTRDIHHQNKWNTFYVTTPYFCCFLVKTLMCSFNSEALFKRFCLLDVKWGANEKQYPMCGELGKLVCMCCNIGVQGPPPPIRWQEIHGERVLLCNTQVGRQELQIWECQQGRSRGFRAVTGTDASSIIALSPLLSIFVQGVRKEPPSIVCIMPASSMFMCRCVSWGNLHKFVTPVQIHFQ